MTTPNHNSIRSTASGIASLIVIAVAVVLTAACSAPASGNPGAGDTTPAAPVQAPTAVLQAPATSQPAAAPTLSASAPSAAPNCTTTRLTPSQTEGPYFKANSPERASLLASNVTGTKLVLTGYVFTADCKPVAHALLDFWQANAQGEYDNSGYTLRGHQFTDAAGRYQLETIVPGLYPGRTEHIHVKVQAPNGPVLTTQLYFPGVPSNQRDGIFDQKLLMTVQDTGNGMAAQYNFVINTGNGQ